MHRIVFWQNIISPHQLPYIREITTFAGIKEVVLVVSESLQESLALQGWKQPSTGSVKVLVNPDSTVIAQLLKQEPQQTVHILGGIRLYPYTSLVFSARSRYGFRCGVVAEGADHRGLKGSLRYLIYSIDYLRYRNLIDFILSMGENGKDWYHRVGWPHEKIFPFAYVTDFSSCESVCLQTELNVHEKIQLLYVGQLIHRKGADILLRALSLLETTHNWHLMIVGGGECDDRLRNLSNKLDLSSRTSFLGVVPNPEIHKLMSDSDFLVLPSRFDGWGAVVNESLMCGTPVLCTDTCGSKDLLMNPLRGEVVPSDNVEKLANAIKKRINKGHLTYHDRIQIKTWTKNISGSSVANYVMSVLEHLYYGGLRPIPPWMNH